MKRKLGLGNLCLAAFFLIAAAPAWDPAPWLDDLGQFRSAIERDYPNLEWLVSEREVSLDRWFSRAADEIRESGDDAGARRAMDRLVERFNDGHLALRWPRPLSRGRATPTASVPATIATFCAARGYDAGQVTPGTAVSIPGYRAVETGGPFPAGRVDVDEKAVGVVRLAVFSPQGYPVLCEQAVALTRTAIDRPCDEACEDRVLTEAFALLTRALINTVERLRAAGAEVLLVDLTRNGGGTEWSEAAARIIAPVALRSAPVHVIRGDAWVARWRALSAKLRREAGTAPATDRSMLLDLARQADAVADGLKPCTRSPCARTAQAGYASGLLRELPAGRLDGRPWGVDVFSASQFPYRDHVWAGPVIVLVDSETWSAAEQFTALLQDNGAAIVMGTRTGGAGCGHLYGNDPVTLTHSGAKLEMPNCARLRKDGSNEVSGIIPDISTGVRWNDGPSYAGRLTAGHFPEAVAKAEALRRGVR
ncbi:S41 family peptidase [Sphingomonas sp. 1P06PA]|uniref:S41 family peptidase n=1 Tax=Sphingomonas sp. 1P06PA TaxID=554121 RepID=UPI0039A433E1